MRRRLLRCAGCAAQVLHRESRGFSLRMVIYSLPRRLLHCPGFSPGVLWDAAPCIGAGYKQIGINIIDINIECKFWGSPPFGSCTGILRRHSLAKRNKQQLSLQVLKKFRIIYGSVRQHFREIERTCGVTGSQLWILQEIAHTSGIGVSELAERLSIHQSTCSQLVEKLVSGKMIIKERSKEDQRRVGLQLTKSAATLLQGAPGPAEGVLPEALQSLSAESIQALDASLEMVIEQLRFRDDRLAEQPLADL